MSVYLQRQEKDSEKNKDDRQVAEYLDGLENNRADRVDFQAGTVVLIGRLEHRCMGLSTMYMVRSAGDRLCAGVGVINMGVRRCHLQKRERKQGVTQENRVFGPTA